MPTIMRNGVPTYISIEEYNKELAKHRKEVLGIDENTGKLRHYKVEDLGKIWVNGQEFTGMAYQGLLTVNTKTYVEEPTRSNDGSIPNINDYDTFIVPRCKVNFKYFNIEDYRRLCEAVQSNEFTVKYYDKQFNEFVLHKMYCEPEEMHKLYNVCTDVFGVLDYEVSFIGTLNDLNTHKVIYDSNGGTIYGNPQAYNSTHTYYKGDRVYIDDNGSYRYFEAIYYENSFTPEKEGQTTILLSDTTYWKKRDLSLYSNVATFTTDNVAYENVYNDEGELVGRNYYIAIYNGTFSGRPFSDTNYWQKISVVEYVPTKTYSSNKVNASDVVYGQFIVENAESTTIYEAVYYLNWFDSVDPTNTKYWANLPLGAGVEVRWGNSIVVENPEELFNAPSGESSDEWNTRPDGSGYTYYPNQSINVFRDLTLYAQWK